MCSADGEDGNLRVLFSGRKLFLTRSSKIRMTYNRFFLLFSNPSIEKGGGGGRKQGKEKQERIDTLLKYFSQWGGEERVGNNNTANYNENKNRRRD